MLASPYSFLLFHSRLQSSGAFARLICDLGQLHYAAICQRLDDSLSLSQLSSLSRPPNGGKNNTDHKLYSKDSTYSYSRFWASKDIFRILVLFIKYEQNNNLLVTATLL